MTGLSDSNNKMPTTINTNNNNATTNNTSNNNNNNTIENEWSYLKPLYIVKEIIYF